MDDKPTPPADVITESRAALIDQTMFITLVIFCLFIYWS